MRTLALFLALLAPAHASKFAPLPLKGEGYLVPQTWAERGLHWGRPELVGLLQRAARRLHAWDPGAILYIGDLSLESGAATRWHRSHRRGIDADLLLFASGSDGRQLPPPKKMQPFQRDNRTLDLRRNWLLTKALVIDSVPLRAIFLANWMKKRILDDARHRGEDDRLLARAERLVHQPSDSGPHDDHMHVRMLTRDTWARRHSP
jgi:penicillin-insensitive murein endopeptidase